MAISILYTLPASHFCEKARWALDITGRVYQEERHAPGFHRSAVKKFGAGPTVPVLVLGNKKVLKNSAEIVKWSDEQLDDHLKLSTDDPALGPLIQDFCDRCERELAPEVIRFCYMHLTREQYYRLSTEGVKDDEAKKFRWLAYVVRPIMNSALKINKQNYENAIRKLNKYYDSVEHLLSDGRKYLFCDRPTVADLTFCSMAAPTMLIQEYGGAHLSYQEAPLEIRVEADRWRKTKVGQYVQAFYKRFRKCQLNG